MSRDCIRQIPSNFTTPPILADLGQSQESTGRRRKSVPVRRHPQVVIGELRGEVRWVNRFGSSAPPATSGVHPTSDMSPQRNNRRDGPCVDGSELARRIFTSQGWSVQPCVRPLRAVHMTAGHNALRGSGPGQKPAFENAMAQVGCPDRRIDRLCITCCSPSQPSHRAGCPARSR